MYSQKFFSELGITLKIAGEIEFYIEPGFDSEVAENDFLGRLLLNITTAGLRIWQMNKEVAPDQYEVALQPNSPGVAVEEIKQLKKIIIQTLPYGHKAIFVAKPYENLPGCGLHIHIGIDDLEGNSLLERAGERGSKEGETEIMLHAIGGLCATMLKNFTCFAPAEESYLRFSAKRNEIEDNGNDLATYNNAPVNVSWGGNNRTTAIRIPASSYDESTRHIEHRVAGADADPEAVVNAILEGVYIGIRKKIAPPEKIYGNAFLKQYDFLQQFPKSLSEAVAHKKIL